MIVDFQGLKMQSFGKRHLQVMEKASRRHNFVGEYPQGIERTSCGCIILLGSICKSWEEQVVDAQFQWEASSRYRKCGMQMQNLRREYPQIPERARCRCNLNMTEQLKSIRKFKEKQVIDTLAWKRASAGANIKAMQIHQLPKEHLRQWINAGYRYIR